MSTRKTHYKSVRLTVNAGLDFPACFAQARTLDLEKARLPMTQNVSEVTCGHCLALLKAEGIKTCPTS